MSMESGVMRMRAIESLAAPSGETITLGPGGQHLMFFGVTQPLAEGETIQITLTFATAGEIVVQAPVRRVAASHANH
jgi:copper(I)-binding protein